jgi:hypothetical protein
MGDGASGIVEGGGSRVVREGGAGRVWGARIADPQDDEGISPGIFALAQPPICIVVAMSPVVKRGTGPSRY